MREKEPYLDVDKAADYLQLHSETVRRMAREKSLPAVKIGRSWRFKVSTLDEWANHNEPLEGVAVGSRASKKILCVDDDFDVLIFLKAVLSNSGFMVDTAQTGCGGVMKVNSESYDLVFLDLEFSDITGAEVMRRISEQGKEMPPIVFLTAYPNSSLLQEALKVCAFTLLAKPIEPRDLLKVVGSLVKQN